MNAVIDTVMNWEDFADRYCKTQEQVPEGLAEILRDQIARYSPDGFFMAECKMLGSSFCGQVVVLPFGPRNTFKSIPDHPFSPRGLASDMSVAIGSIKVEEVPL